MFSFGTDINSEPAFVGICGTDLHEYSSATFIPVKEPHPVTGETAPCGFGHEFSGTVLEVGANAVSVYLCLCAPDLGSRTVVQKGNFQKGDKVAVQPTVCCFECPPCQSDILNCCDKAGFVGLSGGGGGLSDAVCIDSKFVHKLPSNIDLDVGALVEPLAVAWHAVDASPIKKGDSALVLGAGPIGLGVVQCLKARGAETIIVGEVSKQRQDHATHFGATHIFDPRNQDVVKEAKAVTGGQGPNIAFDCAGVPASVKTATLAVRARGTVVNVAIWEKEVPFNPNNIVFGEKKYLAGEFLLRTRNSYC